MDKKTIEFFLSGELPDDKTRELLEWIQKNEANRKYFTRLKNLWTASRLDRPIHKLDIDKEFELLSYQIARRSKKTRFPIKHVTKNPWFRYLSSAAALLILIYSVLLSYYFIHERNKISYNEISTNRGEKASVQLADGTRIWLNSETRLRYPANLNTKNVYVYLEGEAYFDVEKNPNRTFIVRASSLDFAVLGTSFNIKSYSGENQIETTLEEGKISITGKMGNMRLKDPVILRPNQQAIFKMHSSEYSVSKRMNKALSGSQEDEAELEDNTNGKLFNPEMIIAEQVESKLYTSWKDGKLIFKHESFKDLALRMERRYDVKIRFADEKLKAQQYTGVFEKETLEQALKALSLSYSFSYEINKNTVFLSSIDNTSQKR